MPPESYPQINIHQKPKRKLRFLMLLVGIAIVVIGSFYMIGRPPAEFVPGTIVVIPSAVSIKQTGVILERENIIRSASIFGVVMETLYYNKPVIEGDFQFDKPIDVLAVADRMTGGAFGSAQVKVTIPEGSSNRDIVRIVTKAIPAWNGDEFTARAKSFEGYLFPETYHVFKTITPIKFVDLLRNEYSKQIRTLKSDIEKSGRSEKDIIIMASLLEKEALNAEEAKIISGILWKRIKNGQPLQVDAPFLYTLNKTSEELTLNDLKKDGPYNTYTRQGLPVGPIGNPGIAMITAAIYPESSPYNFYLHGTDGQIRYAKTYAEHLQNKQKYLK